MNTIRRGIPLTIVATMVLTLVPSSPADALTLAQVQKRVATIKKQLRVVSDRLDRAELELSQSEDAISAHRIALKRSQQRRAVLSKAVGGRAAELYMLGTQPVSLVSAAGDITTLIQRMNYLEQIIYAERSMLEGIRTLRHRAREQSIRLRDAERHAQGIRNTLAARQGDLSVRLAELSRLESFLESVSPRRGARGSRGAGRGMFCPVVGSNVVSNNYGSPRPGGPHTGVDIRANTGQPVRAVLPARVVDTPTGGWVGIGIVIRDLAGNEWWYAHLSRRYVSVGEHIGAGEAMGAVGNTGRSYGSHLHFEYHPGGGAPSNPYHITASAC